MAQLGWHPMTPYLQSPTKPSGRYLGLLMGLLVAVSAVLLPLSGFLIIPNQTIMVTLRLPTAGQADFSALSDAWPTAELALQIPTANWRVVAPPPPSQQSNLPWQTKDPLAQAKTALAQRQFQQVLALLSNNSSRAALLLRAAALQQLGQHNDVVRLLQNESLTAELHLRLAISYEALQQTAAARFHYRAFLSVADTPSSLQQYARTRLAALGGQS